MKPKILLWIFISFIISYLIFSFVGMSFNPINWEYVVRFVFVFFSLLASIIILLFHLDKKMFYLSRNTLKNKLGDAYDCGNKRTLAWGNRLDDTDEVIKYYTDTPKREFIENIIKSLK